MRKKYKKIFSIILTILLIIFLLFLWEQIVIHYEIPKRILPKPSQIVDYLVSDFTSGKYTLLKKTLFSFRDALFGFSISVILGIILGIIFHQFKILKTIFSPFILISQLLPVPAFAPVVAALLGYGFETKIIIIVLFTIFPVIVTVETTISSLSANYLALFSSYNARKIVVIRKLFLPAILPDLITTMKILTTASLVTSIIAELPLTISGGIGKDIYNSFNNQITTRVWASLVMLCTVSISFFKSVLEVEKTLINKYRYAKE
jgi:ABC-type nitrate/sulfonate/bicarbonate transport system permease component